MFVSFVTVIQAYNSNTCYRPALSTSASSDSLLSRAALNSAVQCDSVYMWNNGGFVVGTKQRLFVTAASAHGDIVVILR